ncbi:hypothetical protein SORBI_3001G319650 [Sorghum bicolor]|uniref:Uncharacterized protein n=1 Tax=Sorghum bicolor TaxID=4558 RepID=A0A1Z5S8M5_SORBI|nr:hypothetical protein SORBI_3001G319650 [Sorghum bicolor]
MDARSPHSPMRLDFLLSCYALLRVSLPTRSLVLCSASTSHPALLCFAPWGGGGFVQGAVGGVPCKGGWMLVVLSPPLQWVVKQVGERSKREESSHPSRFISIATTWLKRNSCLQSPKAWRSSRATLGNSYGGIRRNTSLQLIHG